MYYPEEESIGEVLKRKALETDSGAIRPDKESAVDFTLQSVLLPAEEPSTLRSPKENQMIDELQRYKAFLVELRNQVEIYTRSTAPPGENSSTSINQEAIKLRSTLELVVAELIKKHSLSLELNKKPPQQFFQKLRYVLLGMPNPTVILEANTLTSSWQPANEATGGFFKVEISIEGSEWLPALQRWQAAYPQISAPDLGFDFYRSSLEKLEVPCRAGIIVEVSYVSEYEMRMSYKPGIGPVFSSVSKLGS